MKNWYTQTLTVMALTSTLLALPAVAENTGFSTSTFAGSGQCTLCHDNLNDIAGEDVSIVHDWGATMMANSAKDPFWRAKVASELQRNAALSDVINQKCSRCHAPMANHEALDVQNGSIELLGPSGVLDPAHPLNDAALNGVSCTLCHQISDDISLGTLSGFSGHYHVGGSRELYGPFDNVFAQPMINNVGYTPVFSAHVSESRYCATCHELSTPFVDADGNLLSTAPETEFPEQTPYSEWENSEFADDGNQPQSCQDCHMPRTTAAIANRPPAGSPNAPQPRGSFARHHFAGANSTMLTLLRENAAALDVNTAGLDTGIARARAMLQSAVGIEFESLEIVDNQLEAVVRLSNRSGHKTPTSFPSRRMWLHLRVTDSNDNVVFESGAVNADGSIIGADNDTNRQLVEPHHDLITDASQVQLYEAIMGDSDGNVTFTLLRAAQYLKDNRLTPRGFVKASVPSRVQVYGAAADDPNFDTGHDTVTYRVPVPAGEDLTVNVELNYQTIAHGFIQDLYADAALPEVQVFRSMYEAQPLKHERIAGLQQTLTATRPASQVPLPAAVVMLMFALTTFIGWHRIRNTKDSQF